MAGIAYIGCNCNHYIFKGSWKDFGFNPNFKGNIKWYLIAALIFPVVTATVLIIGATT
jgi:hypothetical protein